MFKDVRADEVHQLETTHHLGALYRARGSAQIASYSSFGVHRAVREHRKTEADRTATKSQRSVTAIFWKCAAMVRN